MQLWVKTKEGTLAKAISNEINIPEKSINY